MAHDPNRNIVPPRYGCRLSLLGGKASRMSIPIFSPDRRRRANYRRDRWRPASASKSGGFEKHRPDRLGIGRRLRAFRPECCPRSRMGASLLPCHAGRSGQGAQRSDRPAVCARPTSGRTVRSSRPAPGCRIERRGTKAGHIYDLLGHSLGGEITVEPYLITLRPKTPNPTLISAMRGSSSSTCSQARCDIATATAVT